MHCIFLFNYELDPKLKVLGICLSSQILDKTLEALIVRQVLSFVTCFAQSLVGAQVSVLEVLKQISFVLASSFYKSIL